MATSTIMHIKTRIVDLNCDIFKHLSTFLDAESLHSLAQTCTQMTNKLADPMIWRDAVLRNKGLQTITATSLRDSDFRIAKVSNSKSLVLSSFLSSLETMILDFQHDSITSRSVKDAAAMLGNLKYLIVFGYWESYSVKVALDRLLPCMISLRGLHVYQKADGQSAEGILDVLKMTHTLQLEELQQISFNKNGVCYNALRNQVTGNHVRSSVKSLCGVQMETLAKVARTFPQLEHLTLRKLFNSEQLREYSRMPTVKSLRVYHEAYGNIQPVFAQLRKLATAFPNLQALDLSDVMTSPCRSYFSITEHDMAKLINACPTLTVLNISTAHNITQASIEYIIRHLHYLKYLILPLSAEVTDRLSKRVEFTEMLSKYQPQLISLIGVCLSSAPNLSEKLPNLRYKSDENNKYSISKLKLNQRSLFNTETNSGVASSAKASGGCVWGTVKQFSQDWFDAYGKAYFYVNPASDHLQLIEPQVVMPNMVDIILKRSAEFEKEGWHRFLAGEGLFDDYLYDDDCEDGYDYDEDPYSHYLY